MWFRVGAYCIIKVFPMVVICFNSSGNLFVNKPSVAIYWPLWWCFPPFFASALLSIQKRTLFSNLPSQFWRRWLMSWRKHYFIVKKSTNSSQYKGVLWSAKATFDSLQTILTPILPLSMLRYTMHCAWMQQLSKFCEILITWKVCDRVRREKMWRT